MQLEVGSQFMPLQASGLCQALARIGKQCQPTYGALVQQVRVSLAIVFGPAVVFRGRNAVRVRGEAESDDPR